MKQNSKTKTGYSLIRFCIDKLRFSLMPQYIRISARHNYKAFEELLRRIKPYVGDIKDSKVLDVGCGLRAPLTLMFHSLGARVVGIDIDIPTRGVNLAKYGRVLTRQGPKRFLTRLIIDLYYYKIYSKESQRVADFPLNFKELDLREMDASRTTFENEEFDLVVSNAVFEHLKNVGAVLAELKRVMKQNAVIYVTIHLFPSLTGGHNVLWSNPDTQQVVLGRVPPWDHLRKQQYPLDPSLNKLRESEYRRLFSKHFEILDWITAYREPECYLSSEVSSELKDYSREELLKRSIVVIARKV